MAPSSVVIPSFDSIIQADRERKKNEQLAKDIFGRPKAQKPNHNDTRKLGAGPSLASRVGIAKASQRSTSNTPKPRLDVESPWSHDLHRAENGKPRTPRTARNNPMSERVKSDLLSEALTAKGATNQARPKAVGPEINIRGAAGPYVVVASNFAPGTTAADIESAMIPRAGDVQNCRIITASPTVIAEMVFGEKQNAEAVIETFNNQKADGRILHVYMKTGGPSPGGGLLARKPISQIRSEPVDLITSEQAPSYDDQREQSDRIRRKADPEVQDGRFGFGNDENEMEIDVEVPPPAVREEEKRTDRRGAYRGDRPREGRDARYEAPRESGRNGYFDRGWEAGRRPRDERPVYGDNFYNPRSRGRGYR